MIATFWSLAALEVVMTTTDAIDDDKVDTMTVSSDCVFSFGSGHEGTAVL